MICYSKEISFKTGAAIEFCDITEDVRVVCNKSGIKNGLLTIFTRHTTTAVKVNERCDRLQKDMLEMLTQTVPAKAYKHDEDTIDNRGNARSHLMSLLLNSSETIPVVDGELKLGTWQSVFFIELDGPRKERKAVVSIIGE